MQLSTELKQELYKEAQTNGLNRHEYLALLRNVDSKLTEAASNSAEARLGINPGDYDIDGKELLR